MATYTITTDSDSLTIDARTADEAAALYAGRKSKAGGPQTLAELVARVEAAGGELTVLEDGCPIARVR